VARIPRGRRKAVLGGVVAAIVLGTAFMLYFVFREHLASAVIGVAGLIIGAASLLVGVVALFDPGTAQATGAATAINTGVVEGPQITAGHDVILEHNPNGNWIGLPEFVMPGVRPVAVCEQGFACQAVSGSQGSPSAARVRASRALMPWRAAVAR
jgi:hypothetical protein